MRDEFIERLQKEEDALSSKPIEQRFKFLALLAEELERAYAKHPTAEPWGRHEFYGILKEEVDELWDAIKTDQPTSLVAKELIQVAAMCLRYYETGDRRFGAFQ